MIIIIGLGNPGSQFKNTRHNVGFMAIDEFARKNNFPEFKLQKKSNALLSEKENILLAKPQTFMNESGKAVKKIISKFPNFSISNIVVIHDDIDLPLGSIKIVKDRGSAGHKGVESIIKSIGNKGLIRIRIGIAPIQSRSPNHRTKAERIVLKSFSKEEKKAISQVLQKVCDTLDLFVKKGLDRIMNEYNK